MVVVVLYLMCSGIIDRMRNSKALVGLYHVAPRARHVTRYPLYAPCGPLPAKRVTTHDMKQTHIQCFYNAVDTASQPANNQHSTAIVYLSVPSADINR